MKLKNNGTLSLNKTSTGTEYWHIEHLEGIQKELLSILKFLDSFCREHNILYFADAGTYIGALRHNGFIPWDDDTDISLAKTDYLKLVSLLCNETNILNTKNYLFYTSDDNLHCSNFLASKSSCFLKVSRRLLVPTKVDIRPLNVIKNTKQEIEKNRIYRDTANYLLFKRIRYSYEEIKSVIKYFGSREKFMKFYNNEYGLESINDDVILTHPYFEFTKEDFYINPDSIYPLRRHLFEDMQVNIPNTDMMLKKLYGDYLSYPPLDERKPASKFNIHLSETDSQIVHILAVLLRRLKKSNFLTFLKYLILYRYK
ncbi:phosphorylcholine transferase LicD [Spirochaetia bacterium]|nr:phosphorylcholine transferase LicD [Spirochaetia bacterium]